MEGKVWLVGAGPGDPGLITVRGREALEQADVVVYDRLVPKEFLDHVPEGAEVVYAGRQPGLHDVTEDEITALLVRKAREGKRVVRMHGGDPFVFGEGDEEAEALRAAGVPFEVVSGVTSAVAAPAYAGIPVTHSGCASSFAVVLGDEEHGRPGSDVDWSKLATAVDTVIVMEVQNLERVAQAMIRHGRPADTPVAVVNWGTRARQQTVVGTLADITRRVAEAGIEPPAVTVIGEVVRLRDRLRWYDDRPLFGKRVLVTRIRQHAATLRRLLQEEGAEVVELPALEIAETVAPEIIARVIGVLAEGQYSWVLFTSANAVERFFRHLGEQGRDARAFGATRVCALGAATVEALARNGIRADAAPDETAGEDVLTVLTGRAVGRRRILVPRADNARPDLIAALRKAGAEVEEIPLYVSAIPRQPNRESLARLRRGEIDVVTFVTSTAVTNLANMLGGDLAPVRQATVACMGRLTAQTARDFGLHVDVVTEADNIPAFVAAIRAHLAGRGR